ncbi:hypothetical protein ZWY2020_054520 [Hordeum vulgare]|nr:hypothetical protein ZWY2020_054520 [Hordeum vulgare]
MATIYDIGLGGFNILMATIFLLIFAFPRLQPINDRIFFPNGTSRECGQPVLRRAPLSPSSCMNIPPDPDESVSELVEHFFLVNHPDHYLKHQTVYNANKLADLVEKKKMRNWLDYYQNKLEFKIQKANN